MRSYKNIPLAEKRRKQFKREIVRMIRPGDAPSNWAFALELSCGHIVNVGRRAQKIRQLSKTKRTFCIRCSEANNGSLPPPLHDHEPFKSEEPYCIDCRTARVNQWGDSCGHCKPTEYKMDASCCTRYDDDHDDEEIHETSYD